MSRYTVSDALAVVQSRAALAAAIPSGPGEHGFALVSGMQPSSAHHFLDSASLAAYHAAKLDSVRYARDASTNTVELERIIEQLHPGFRAFAFSSGMSAIATVLDAVRAGLHRLRLPDEVYRKTVALGQQLAATSPVEVETYPTAAVAPPLSGQPVDGELWFVEAPSNPHLRVTDLRGVDRGPQRTGVVVLDATLAGLGDLPPALLEIVDVIVYSCTKYIGGHNDVIGGLALVRDALRAPLWEARSRLGTIMPPHDAHLVVRSLRTFDARLDRQEVGARHVLRHLAQRADEGLVASIHYPGEFANAHEADAVAFALGGPRGSLVSFVPTRSREELAERIDTLRTARMAPSFGSVDSLVEIPSYMSHAAASLDDLAAMGLEPNLVRFSVGAENPALLTEDIDRLLC
ncbi:PLP-dependent transferase [Microcella sp.]|uniref:PLP-dependent transferase n=1 Tax=Microcella sp. TaxID=1913979 RepID=UPI00391B8C79